MVSDSVQPYDVKVERGETIETEHERTERKEKITIQTEDILAIGAVIVAIIIAIAVLIGRVDIVAGGGVIGGLVGVAGITEIIKAKRKKSRKTKK